MNVLCRYIKKKFRTNYNVTIANWDEHNWCSFFHQIFVLKVLHFLLLGEENRSKKLMHKTT